MPPQTARVNWQHQAEYHDAPHDQRNITFDMVRSLHSGGIAPHIYHSTALKFYIWGGAMVDFRRWWRSRSMFYRW
jgi:hypothetical protein